MKTTAFTKYHIANGAKMAEFAGAFKKSRSILSHRLPFLGQLSLSEDNNVRQLGASRQT